jgi:hypothetical protein
MTTSSFHICPTSLLTHVETIVRPLNMKHRHELVQHAVADVLYGVIRWQCLGRG